MAEQRTREGTVNFAPGPAQLPTEVIQEALKGALNYNGTGIGAMEMSHRSPEYAALNQETQDILRRLLEVPPNYSILFLQGGGTAQFAAVPLNLTTSPDQVADYFVTGVWSEKSAKEAEKFVKVNRVLPTNGEFTTIAERSEWSLSPNAAYVYYCWNETVHGVEFHFVPDTGDVPLVCDASSNFLTRRIDLTKFDLIYAGAQKNVGTAGVTIVIVRKGLLGSPRSNCPIFLDYTVQDKANSVYNTPPVWCMYMLNLMLKWVENLGGVDSMAELADIKSKLVFDVINASAGFYSMPVEVEHRSRINIPFRITQRGVASDELEAKFLKEAAERGLLALKGHRSVGGIRASLYNAVTVEQTYRLHHFMEEFMRRNRE